MFRPHIGTGLNMVAVLTIMIRPLLKTSKAGKAEVGYAETGPASEVARKPQGAGECGRSP